MAVTFAGVELAPPEPELLEVCRRWWDEQASEQFAHPGYNVKGIDHLPVPSPPDQRPPRPGVLVWPTGASRWACFHYFATAGQLARVRAAVGTTDPAAKPLVISDGRPGGKSVSPLMYLLEPRPVFQTAAAKDLYLLTLVDDRYFWWQRGNWAALTTPATWSLLLTSYFTALGLSASVPSVPAGYSTPSTSRWAVGYKPVPVLIDAACRTVGLRCCRDLDGTVRLVTAATAQAADQARWDANRGANNGNVVHGGRATSSEVYAGAPAAVAVVFPGDTPTVSTVTLASLGYGYGNGVAAAVGQVNADLPATASVAQRSAYAQQAATDYYQWWVSWTDCVFRSVALLTGPTGLEDRVEWEHTAERVATRVVRVPLADRNTYGDRLTGGIPPPVSPPPPPPPASLPTVYEKPENRGLIFWQQPRMAVRRGDAQDTGFVELPVSVFAATNKYLVTALLEVFVVIPRTGGLPIDNTAYLGLGHWWVGQPPRSVSFDQAVYFDCGTIVSLGFTGPSNAVAADVIEYTTNVTLSKVYDFTAIAGAGNRRVAAFWYPVIQNIAPYNTGGEVSVYLKHLTAVPVNVAQA